MAVNPVAAGYPKVIPYLVVNGAAQALDFYKDVLGGTERMRMVGPDGRVGHAEIVFGDSVVMLADPHPEMDILDPGAIGGTPVSISLYVDDVDHTFAAALAAGAVELQPLEDKFYGDRTGQFEDPFGHRWTVMTHTRDVTPEEMAREVAAYEAG